MRVLHLIDAHSPDGGPCTLRLLADVMHNLNEAQHETLLLGPNHFVETACRCGVEADAAICPPRALPWAGRASLRNYLEETYWQGRCFDLIHGWTLRTAAMAASMDLPSLATLHTGPSQGLASAYSIRSVIHSPQQPLLAASMAVRKEYRSRGVIKNRLTLLPPAVNPVGEVLLDRETVRQRWVDDVDTQIENDDFVIGLLGEPINWIDVRSAMNIACRARLSGRRIKLIVAPEAGSTAARIASQQVPRMLSMGELVAVDDEATEPWRIVRGLDAALVLGSGTRARPASSALPLLWALAGGVPIVAELSDALGDLIEDDVSGWLVKPGDVNAAAERIARLYDDRARAAQLSENGRQLIRDAFDINEYCNRLKHSYDLLLADREVRTLEDSSDDLEISEEAPALT